MRFCKVSVRVIILTLHYRGCRGLKFPSQGTLSPRAVLLVEVLYLLLLCCPWMQNRAAVCDGSEVQHQPCRLWGSYSDTEGDSGSEAEFGVSHLGGSAWLGSPRVTSSSLGQSGPPAHHGRAGLRSEHSAVLRLVGKQQRWCCACPLAPTSSHAVCVIHLFVWELWFSFLGLAQYCNHSRL